MSLACPSELLLRYPRRRYYILHTLHVYLLRTVDIYDFKSLLAEFTFDMWLSRLEF